MKVLLHEEANLVLQKCLFGPLFIAVIAMTSIQGKSDIGVFVKLQKTIRNKSLDSNFNVNRFNKHTDDMLFRRKLFITTNCSQFKYTKHW